MIGEGQPPSIAFQDGPQIPILLILQELSIQSQNEIQAAYWRLAYESKNGQTENMD